MNPATSKRTPKNAAISVVVVGAGGNIGSHLVPHLGRLPDIACVTLIDRDVYESRNLASQAITPRDVGRRKAGVQARILRRINSSLTVTALNHAVEDLPLGRMRADVILACLDSRSARQYVNQAAWRLGVPWIDAGVEAGGWLARVNVYVPGPDNPCLECAWDQRDYESLEQTYPCIAGERVAYATNAPSSLGGLAASLQAIECQKLISKRADALIGQQVVIDARHHKHYLTSFRRNSSCRLFDHNPWKIRRLSLRVKQSTLLGLIEITKTGTAAQRLSVEGKSFVSKVICGACGYQKRMSAFMRSSNGAAPRCSRCGGRMFVPGSERAESIDPAAVSVDFKRRSLQGLGIRTGDVVSIESGRAQLHYEINDA
jgi:molybdopterin/thiamine biosynthesis adenylyltransferase